MSMESFAEVFAKKSDDVEKAYRKQQKNAHSYGFFSAALAMSAMLCMVLISSDRAAVLTDKLAGALFALVMLLIAIAVVLFAMAFAAKIKAARLYSDLDNNYIKCDRYGRMPEFYE